MATCFSISWPASPSPAPAIPIRAWSKRSKSRHANFCISAAATITTSRWSSWRRSSASWRREAGTKKVFFTNSGTETVEAAIKLARYHTKRQHVIAFHGAFHGRTLGALSLTASRASHRAHFGPLIPGVHHVPYGFCHRCPYHLTYGSCGIECVGVLEKMIFRYEVRPEEVAAIFVEPIQGEGGYIVPPPEYLPMLQELCRKHGMLLVADEIQSGFGRTGKMFASEHWGIEPDILCAAKGIASGMPLGRDDRARGDQHVDARAPMAARSAAIRWHAPRRWRPSRCSKKAWWRTRRRWARFLKEQLPISRNATR